MASFEYRLLAFQNNADPDDIEEAVNSMAETGWRVAATGGFGTSHIVYFERERGADEIAPEPIGSTA